jgi:hypothetical protein
MVVCVITHSVIAGEEEGVIYESCCCARRYFLVGSAVG